MGAAGSIGSAFVRELLPLRPTALTLVDIDENALVEIVREMRSGTMPLPARLTTLSLGLGSLELERALTEGPRPDHLVNFAALKHVRAERDVHTAMRMLDTNVAALARTADQVAGSGLRTLFSVSSDKAVRPANLMGASKALMERVLWRYADRVRATSARFANVAFSAGSLLDGFLQRFAKRQPISAPLGVRRYFISEAEAGQLCVLAAFVGRTREVFVPEIGGEQMARSLVDVATTVIRGVGLEPTLCGSDEEARMHPALRSARPTEWPCYFAPADTTGEKEIEEFVGPDEVIDRTRFRAVGVVRRGAEADEGLERFLAGLSEMRQTVRWNKAALVDLVRVAVPDLSHTELARSLDERM